MHAASLLLVSGRAIILLLRLLSFATAPAVIIQVEGEFVMIFRSGGLYYRPQCHVFSFLGGGGRRLPFLSRWQLTKHIYGWREWTSEKKPYIKWHIFPIISWLVVPSYLVNLGSQIFLELRFEFEIALLLCCGYHWLCSKGSTPKPYIKISSRNWCIRYLCFSTLTQAIHLIL